MTNFSILPVQQSAPASIFENITKAHWAFFPYKCIGSYTGELNSSYYWHLCDANYVVQKIGC